jgi:ligand-binding SRPBCC domain-containing protein
MTVRFQVETMIAAPVERVFDLSLSVEDHLASMARSRERLLFRTSSGPFGLGDEVAWAGRHFGITWKMHSRITELTRPERFVDEQVRGPFAWFRHEHRFEATEGGTRMVDAVSFAAPLGLLGRVGEWVLLRRYLRRLIAQRNVHIRGVAERAAGM